MIAFLIKHFNFAFSLMFYGLFSEFNSFNVIRRKKEGMMILDGPLHSTQRVWFTVGIHFKKNPSLSVGSEKSGHFHQSVRKPEIAYGILSRTAAMNLTEI